MSRVCGLFLFGIGIGLFLALIFPKSLFMVIMAVLCLLAALKENEQKQLIEAMDYAQSVPSLSQAQRIKKLSKDGKLSIEKMQEILSEIKKGEITRVTFTNEQHHRYFPNNYTPEMMKREIVAILKIWMEQYWDK